MFCISFLSFKSIVKTRPSSLLMTLSVFDASGKEKQIYSTVWCFRLWLIHLSADLGRGFGDTAGSSSEYY